VSSRGELRTLVFAATYNERGDIEALCRDILGLPGRSDLLVVDDNSTDGTGIFLDELAAREPRLKVIHRPRKLGLGTAHKLAMAYAAKRGYDVLVTMDADFSHKPVDIPRLVDALDGRDFVIGSRYALGGSCDYTGYRRYVSLLANRLARLLLGIPLFEFTTSFRAFRVDMLRRVDFPSIQAQGYSFFMESVWHIARAGFIVGEVPITFSDRRHGESKIPRFEIVNGAGTLIRLCLKRLRRWRRPKIPSRLVDSRCYLCGSDMVVELYPATGALVQRAEAYRCTSMEHGAKPRIVHCLACDLAAIDSGAIPQDTAALYEEVVDAEYLRNKKARERTFNGVFTQIAPLLPPRGRMLEVGAYCGLFMQIARRAGWEIEGVEPSRWAAEYASQSGLIVHQGSLEERYAQLSGPYDAVVMWDVLEHLPDPVGALRRIGSLLPDQGVLCFTTLDRHSWFPRLLGRRWPWIMAMHLYYPTTGVVRDMAGRAGFELVQTAPYPHYASLRYLAEKAVANLPTWLGSALRPVLRCLPASICVPVQLGDVKLYICRKIGNRHSSTGGGESVGRGRRAGVDQPITAAAQHAAPTRTFPAAT